MNLYYVPMDEIRKTVDHGGRVFWQNYAKQGMTPKDSLDAALRGAANIHRINSLYMIQQAGGGHIGTCFSSAEIVTLLHHEILREDDIFFSSKGHDAPLFYSCLIAKGIIPFDEIHTLRRPGGLPGHPDIRTPGVVTNTGSLGMGISKAKGMILARRLKYSWNYENFPNNPERVFVLMGDGELQEGQVWESLAGAVRDKMSELVVIVDMNNIQSDLPVIKTAWMGKYAPKFKAFGWHTDHCQGHEIDQLREKINEAIEYDGGPSVIFCETVKGKGSSLIEAPGGTDFYQYHSGALTEEEYEVVFSDLERDLEVIEVEQKEDYRFKNEMEPYKHLHPISEFENFQHKTTAFFELIVCALSGELNLIAHENEKVLFLDADLLRNHALDIRPKLYPDRFFEFGIAEQDMVSTAGGLALEGFIPICHSFACFLTRRANEQIYNNCTEGTHVIYVGTLAGVLPNEIGHSHEAMKDIELMRTMPGMEILTPYSGEEVRAAIRWAVFNTTKPVYIRIPVMPDVERMRNA